MGEQASRYFDFSEDDELITEFDPGGVSDVMLQIHGAQIQKHMRLRNPTAAIKGLLGYQILTTDVQTTRIERALFRIMLLLGANAALVGYVAYLLS